MLKLITLCAAIAGFVPCQDTRPAPRAPKEARFAVRNELKVIVPEGARKVRVWFAYPREDRNQTIANAKVESPLPHRRTSKSTGRSTPRRRAGSASSLTRR